MNHDFDETGDDTFRELLAPLRPLEPSPAGKAANRQAIASELSVTAPNAPRPSQHLRPVRTIATVAAALVAGIAIGWSARGAAYAPETVTVTKVPEKPPIEPLAAKADAVAVEAPLTFYASETYVCGIGRISSSSGYRFQE